MKMKLLVTYVTPVKFPGRAERDIFGLIFVNRITAISPGKKRQKKRSSMAPRIETDRYPASGIKLAAKAQCARYRKGLYPILNPRRIFSDFSPNRYVFEFLQINDVDIRQ